MPDGTSAAFVPAQPPRLQKIQPVWRIFFGEASTNMLVGWPDAAFDLDYMYRRIFTVRYHMIADPDAIGRVFLDEAQNYPKPPLVVRLLTPLGGNNLFVAHDQDWRDQRRLMAPVFTPGSVAEFAPIFADVAAKVADGWAGRNRIDVSAEATRATFDVISRSLFSGEASLSSDEADRHIANMLAAMGKYHPGMLLGAPWLDRSKTARDGRAGRRYLHEALSAFIRRRQANPDPPRDFLTRLMEAFAADYPPDIAAQLTLSNAIVFFVAGHETTANAVTWALYLMGGDPEVQERAAAEAIAARAAGGSAAEAVARLPYVRMVLEEAMRLYPPAPRLDRSAAKDDDLSGHPIRKGDMVGIWPWMVHRNRRLWDDPDRFNPENFSPEAKARHHRFQYIPFGAGPRTCIGAAFALSEGVLILAHWLARYRFRLDPDHEVTPTAAVTLRPKGGLPMFIESR